MVGDQLNRILCRANASGRGRVVFETNRAWYELFGEGAIPRSPVGTLERWWAWQDRTGPASGAHIAEVLDDGDYAIVRSEDGALIVWKYGWTLEGLPGASLEHYSPGEALPENVRVLYDELRAEKSDEIGED